MREHKATGEWYFSKNRPSLNAAQRIEIKAKFKRPGVTLKSLALEYAVSVSTISNCVNNKYR